MNTDIEKCLALTMEIEGLLHLMQHRGLETLPSTVKTLLASKSAALAEMLTFGTPTPEVETVQQQVEDTIESAPIAATDKDDDAEQLAETVEYEQEEDSEPDAGSPDAYTTRLDEAQAEEDEADTESAEMDDARRKYYGEIATKRSKGSQLMQLFTLNNRYRFTRELFGNSPTAFEVIMDEISSFASLDEAKQYLANRQGINLLSQSAKDFINIIAPFYR